MTVQTLMQNARTTQNGWRHSVYYMTCELQERREILIDFWVDPPPD